jgi:hypothetical protein
MYVGCPWFTPLMLTWISSPPVGHGPVPGGTVVTVMTGVPPAGPVAPVAPVGPVAPVAPAGPIGIVIGTQFPPTHATSVFVDEMYATVPCCPGLHGGRSDAEATDSSRTE